MVARIKGDGSPILARHSDFINSITSGGNLIKWALTLFFKISPLKDLVGSSKNRIMKQIQYKTGNGYFILS